MESIHKTLIENLQNFLKNINKSKVVIGLSGGIDSSLVLKLAVDALGNENVTGILMPEQGLTKQENIDHAKGLADYFGVQTHVVPINSALIACNTSSWIPSTLAQMNTKARIRMVLLYSYANTNNTIVLGTSNKSESLIGYGTKHGDIACDVQVIGNLFKTEVWELSKYLNLPDEIINKAPSAELAVNQTDEEELGATYNDLDKVLKIFTKENQDLSKKDKLAQVIETAIEKGLDSLLVRKVAKLIKDNLHKGAAPPILNIK